MLQLQSNGPLGQGVPLSQEANSKACPGYMHYIAMEEIPGGEVVTAAMFLVNKQPAIVLFDSGASYSFMSQTFASKHDQKIIIVDKDCYCISSSRASISTNQIVRDVLISIKERGYTMDLIVLPGLGIDVILGMNWMSGHGAIIDNVNRTVKLKEPKGDGTFLVQLPRSFDL